MCQKAFFASLLVAFVASTATGQVETRVETPIASQMAAPATQIAKVVGGRGVLVLTVTASDTQPDNWSIAGVVHDEFVRLLAERSVKVLVSPKVDTLTCNRRIKGPLADADLDRIRSLAVADLLAVAVYRHRDGKRTIDVTLRDHSGDVLSQGQVTLEESHVKMADNIPGLNRKVVDFCIKNVGKKVGDGSAWALAAEALAEAGAKRTGVYIHGRKLGAIDHPLPGDVVRIEDARFRGQGKWRTIGHGTAIVETVQSPTVFTAFHQKDKAITRTTFALHEKRDGLIEIYRPRPKVLKAIEPRSGDDDASEVTAPVEIPVAEGVTLALRPIEAGRFRMGDATVTLSRPFLLGITEVTQDQWDAVIGKNPSETENGDLPVTNVSWNDVQSFLKQLNESPAGKSYRFRLPTSAEWEYACRAGASTRYSFGDDTLDLVEYAWFLDNSERKLSPVAQLRPNKWGLFDMHGNVWELTQDIHSDAPLGNPAKGATDPTGPSEGKSRTIRGGCYLSESGNLRSSNRGWLDAASNNSKTGFRVVAEPN
jgi:formylglycine-generating enzyme required for sulfatase activity